MEEIFDRQKLLIGEEKLQSLHQKTVAIFGLGGVGSYVAEGLARSGIGNFIIIDNDKIDVTNINRQIIATTKTIGRFKVDVAEERIEEINPSAKVIKYAEFVGEENENIELFDNIKNVDYIVDAIDTVSSKIRIIEFAKAHNIPVISALGTGNKLDPTKLKLADIYDTKICPLAKVMRKELRSKGIPKLKVVYSKEEPLKPNDGDYKTPASISFVPSVAGLIIAGEVVKDIING